MKYQISGHFWMDLRVGFGKIQKALQQDIKDGAAPQVKPCALGLRMKKQLKKQET